MREPRETIAFDLASVAGSIDAAFESGADYEVLKKFPTPLEVRAAIVASGGSEPTVEELPYYWFATYLVGIANQRTPHVFWSTIRHDCSP
jgi:hypothetical protein